MPTVQIPKVGNVQFPDTMKPEEITQAAGELHDKALMHGVMQFVGQDPALSDLPQSDFHKHLSGVAALLEKSPRLARAIDAGMSVVSSQDAKAAAEQGTQGQGTSQQQVSEP